MYKASPLNLQFSRSSISVILLLLSWILGLALGIGSCLLAAPSFFSVMRSAILAPVSIVGLLVVFGLPFLLTALAAFCSRTGFLIPLAFCKAFCFGFVSCGLEFALPGAGWLLRLLVLLPDLLIQPVLLWLWLRCMDPDGCFWKDGCWYALACLALGILEQCLVSPFLALL